MADLELEAMLRDKDINVIARTERKYGTLGEALAMNIVDNSEVAGNILIKGLQKMWYDGAPPEGTNFSANFLRKIRDVSVECRKTKPELPEINQLKELEYAALPPYYENRYTPVETLAEYISEFLNTLDEEFRAVFVQRYFLCVNELRLAQINHYSHQQVQDYLKELIAALRTFLEKKGASCTAMTVFEAIGGIDDASVILGTAYQAPERKEQSKKKFIISALICALIAVVLLMGPAIKNIITGQNADPEYSKTHTAYSTVAELNKVNGTAFVGFDFGDDDDLRVTTQEIVVTHPEGYKNDVSSWEKINYNLSGNSKYASKYKMTFEAVPGNTAQQKAEPDVGMVETQIRDTTIWYHEYVSTQGTTNCYSADVFFCRDNWTYNIQVITSINDRTEGYSEGYICRLLDEMMK